MEILFATRRQMRGLGEVEHMGRHMGVVLNKNFRACNPFPLSLPPADPAILAPLTDVVFFHIVNAGGVKGNSLYKNYFLQHCNF